MKIFHLLEYNIEMGIKSWKNGIGFLFCILDQQVPYTMGLKNYTLQICYWQKNVTGRECKGGGDAN